VSNRGKNIEERHGSEQRFLSTSANGSSDFPTRRNKFIPTEDEQPPEKDETHNSSKKKEETQKETSSAQPPNRVKEH